MVKQGSIKVVFLHNYGIVGIRRKEETKKERKKNKTKKEKKGEKEVSNSIYTNSRSTAPRLLLVFRCDNIWTL